MKYPTIRKRSLQGQYVRLRHPLQDDTRPLWLRYLHRAFASIRFIQRVAR